MSPALRLPELMVLLINLPRSTDRRARMERRMAALGLDYELMPAVDGRNRLEELLPSVDVAAFERHVGRDVLPGEIGCYHSHLRAWRHFLASDAQVLLVLEDDMVFHDDFADALRTALRGRAHWDMLKLSKIRAKQPVCQGLLGPYRLNAYIGAATGFGAYLVQRETAQRLLPRLLPIRAPIDRELEQVQRHDIRHFGLEPFPSHPQDEGQSTITGSNFGAVKRYSLSRRWTKYAEQTTHLMARVAYLARKGRLQPRHAALPLE
ncbi:MAG: glycosyltransferase family 25 protein [Hydrogenophaga sp.]|jgi:glycosyl transferase family 25|uniref:glycosyltransferase family 25 protein n=1 Tax=Hydrogenophaga sp. TaxID=1904254 RepID=UPI002725193C|nr:glycosyltransferase family 25 protein [Hydrogenophaga sp.]MDO9568511.1 glycosyltransferase family 25 protein [Hydrogenophaga sp.]MDP3376261.1 glycosyltransferase family 25 protein [Hydrogenophaga sp.]